MFGDFLAAIRRGGLAAHARRLVSFQIRGGVYPMHQLISIDDLGEYRHTPFMTDAAESIAFIRRTLDEPHQAVLWMVADPIPDVPGDVFFTGGQMTRRGGQTNIRCGFLRGRRPAMPGQMPVMADWVWEEQMHQPQRPYFRFSLNGRA